MVASVLDDYWEQHAKKLPSAESIGIRIKHLKKFFGIGTVDTINAKSMQRYKSVCESDGLSVGTINLHRNVLRAACRRAVRMGDLTAAPFIANDKEPDPKPYALSRSDVARMLLACRVPERRHFATFILLAVYTGARKSAILQLTWSRVNFTDGTVDFRVPGVVYSKKKRAETALPARVLAHLWRVRSRARSEHVIEYEGKPIKAIKTVFRAVAKEAGVPHATPHTLKHTAVTLLLRVAKPWTVSGITATSMRTLERVYGKHLMEDKREAVEAVTRGVQRSPRKNRANFAKSIPKGKQRDTIKGRKNKG